MRALLLCAATTAFCADIPRAWTTAAVADLELPLARHNGPVRHISEADYYRLPVRKFFKTYPIYHPDREPPGYWAALQKKDPEPALPEAPPATPSDWIRNGEILFNAPASFGPVFFSAENLRDPNFYRKTGMPVASDGTIPFATWVVRQKGKVELGSMGCNTCHTRVMPDGTVVPGAQGNNPGDRQGAALLRAFAERDPAQALNRMRAFARQFELPWLDADPNQAARTLSLEQLVEAGERLPPGVTARSHTSLLFAPQIPDIIGVRDRQYLDHTGLVRHRSPADLMRYVILVQDAIGLAGYGGAQPSPPSANQTRTSDEHLYALTQYIYSLKPPANPNRPSPLSERGRAVFESARCGRCHTAPLYTNNKLIPVDGFSPPADHRRRFDIDHRPLGTDPRYALYSKKGTGYYKVPSLKGLWYRGPLEHGGNAATLEDWFHPSRPSRVPGHEFGTKLDASSRQALIAYLQTL